MRESIGSIFLYNIIITFLIIVFALLAAIMSYSKAFKVNSIILNRIEKYEGYNDASIEKINEALSTVGYRINSENQTCDGISKNGKSAINVLGKYEYDINSASYGTVSLTRKDMRQYFYCVYLFDGNDDLGDSNHYRYGVTSFIYFDVPILNRLLRLPIYSQTDSMYYYSFSNR